jgi:hypothetical protein
MVVRSSDHLQRRHKGYLRSDLLTATPDLIARSMSSFYKRRAKNFFALTHPPNDLQRCSQGPTTSVCAHEEYICSENQGLRQALRLRMSSPWPPHALDPGEFSYKDVTGK